MGTLYVESGDSKQPVQCLVHPMVVIAVLDHHRRRSDGQERVVGTLLGYTNDKNQMHITNCFPVPHVESADQVGVKSDFHHSMYEMYQKINPKEVIVGWYATVASGSPLVTFESSVIHHEFYATQVEQPVHLVVNTSLSDMRMAVQAFVSSSLELAGVDFGAQFDEINASVWVPNSERLGFDMIDKASRAQLTTGAPSPLLPDMNSLELSIETLVDMLDTIEKYVTQVENGEIEADPEVGRLLSDTLTSLPNLNSTTFEKMLTESLQDLLMVAYLANLTRTQLAFAERLNTVY